MQTNFFKKKSKAENYTYGYYAIILRLRGRNTAYKTLSLFAFKPFFFALGWTAIKWLNNYKLRKTLFIIYGAEEHCCGADIWLPIIFITKYMYYVNCGETLLGSLLHLAGLLYLQYNSFALWWVGRRFLSLCTLSQQGFFVWIMQLWHKVYCWGICQTTWS